MSKNKTIKETYIKCPNCKRLKNANYKPQDKEARATCFCGTLLTKKINKIE